MNKNRGEKEKFAYENKHGYYRSENRFHSELLHIDEIISQTEKNE